MTFLKPDWVLPLTRIEFWLHFWTLHWFKLFGFNLVEIWNKGLMHVCAMCSVRLANRLNRKGQLMSVVRKGTHTSFLRI